MFWVFGQETWRILVLWPGVESSPLSLECEVLTTGPSGKSRGVFFFNRLKVKVTQLCRLFSTPMDYKVHGILQARKLEWVAVPFSRGSSQPRDWTQGSHIASGFFTSWATREVQEYWSGQPIPSPGDLPNQELKQGLLYCRRILYQLSYQGSPVLIDYVLKIWK